MSAATVRVVVDDVAVAVPVGASVAAAVAVAGRPFRRSPGGELRAPLCGMGVCFECRVGIDGVAGQRSCMVPVHEGMRVTTDG